MSREAVPVVSLSRDGKSEKAMRRAFASARPFPHLVLDRFLSPEAARAAGRSFIPPHAPHEASAAVPWCVYDNPLERKLTCSDAACFPQPLRRVLDAVTNASFVTLLRRITGVQDLQHDPHLHGAGLHFYPTGGGLGAHLDYSVHPITGKRRCLNLIVFLTERWEEGWGGNLHLYASDDEESGVREPAAQVIAPRFNRAVLFEASDTSWHAVQGPIACPLGAGRQSIAVYYTSARRGTVVPRARALFTVLPSEDRSSSEDSDGIRQLCRVRAGRRLEAEDVAAHVPHWVSPMRRYLDLLARAAGPQGAPDTAPRRVADD